jgi:NitT/TauT family transport system ATP-binding protein
VISVKNLSKTYLSKTGSHIEALRDISFDVEDRELVTIVGPSGCGKSTLLKILAGILPKSGGTVTLGGRPVEGPRRDIGIVFQAPVLLPWRTVFDNVLVPVEIQRMDRHAYEARARELLALTGLIGFEKKYPFELSGGMQQRVGISRALVCDPEILLMDEPFGALDAMTREYMNMELLRIWRESQKTILFVTHSIPEAVLLADRVIVITSRPGTINRIVPIALPRPRKLEMTSTKQFGKHTTEIRAMMQAEAEID